MKITAVSVGTRGDVQPLIELGQEMIRRGHEFSVMTYEAFRPLCEEKNVPYIHMDGEADRLMQLLVTDYRTDMDFVKGCRTLYRENPDFMDQVQSAVKGSDAVMYGTCSGLVRHVCDYLGIPCIRYFYSPMDPTDQYSLYSVKHNCREVLKSYSMIEPGMNMITLLTGNAWRKKKGMKSWSLFSDYRTQNGKPVLTLYPTTKAFMPPDMSWGSHICVAGYFYHPEEDATGYTMPDELRKFLAAGEKPVFVCFGKARSADASKLQEMTVNALCRLGVRAVVQADLSKMENIPENIYPVKDIPYSRIFPKAKAVIHHGGNTTCGIALWAGVPALVLPIALDQWFYGRAVAENGCGPEPLYWRKKLPSQEQIIRAVLTLVTEDYSEGLRRVSAVVRTENGCKTAADLIENWDWSQYK